MDEGVGVGLADQLQILHQVLLTVEQLKDGLLQLDLLHKILNLQAEPQLQISVVDSNTWNLDADPDPEFWSNLDPDPQQWS